MLGERWAGPILFEDVQDRPEEPDASRPAPAPRHARPPALARHRGPGGGRGRGPLRPRISPSLRPLLPGDQHLGLGQPAPAHPVSGKPQAERQHRHRAPRLRHPAAGGAPLPDRRARKPLRHAVPGAGPDLGHGAHPRAHARARPSRNRLRHLPGALPQAPALVSGAELHASHSSTSRESGPLSSSGRPSPASMPGGWPRRRASSPRRSPRPSWCSPASSTCPSSTAWRRRPPTNSERRSPPSPW